VGGQEASADQIRLKDGTEVSATLIRTDGESVVVQFQRSSIDTVNGQPLAPPVTAGAVAPAFKIVDLAGTTHSLADNRGHVTLLQFWASWCPYCRSDLPMMKQLFTQYQDKGLRILTFSVDQDLDALQAFIRNEQVPYPVVHVATQPSLTELYEMRGIPAYFLIDADGKITQIWRGSLTATKADLEDALARLLTASGT
jgi:peroxiredoxin